MITRQAVITSLHEPDKFILAIVQVGERFARAPRCVRGALQDHEPSSDVTAIQYDLKHLLEKSGAPQPNA